MIINRSLIFFLLFYSFLFQQFWIGGISTAIKPYMIVTLFCLPFAFKFSINNKLKLPLFTLVVLIFFAYMISTTFWAANSPLALIRTIGILLLIICFYCLYVLSDNMGPTEFVNKFYIFSKVFMFASLTYFAFGLLSYYILHFQLGDERKLYGLYMEGILPRMRGFADSPNNYVLMVLPFFFSALLFVKKIDITFYFLSVVTVLLTYSITGYIAFALPLLYLLFARGIKTTLIVLGFGCVVVVTIIALYNHYSDFAATIDARSDRVTTGSGRFELFWYAIKLIEDKPILGYGLAQSRVYLEGFQGRDLQSMHNSFLEVYFEGGVIGVFLFIFCWGALLRYLKRIYINRRERNILYCYVLSLLVFSSANMMVYVELMVLNIFCVCFYANLCKNNLYYRT